MPISSASNTIRVSGANATLAVTSTFVHSVGQITQSQNAPIPTPNIPPNVLPTPVKVNSLVRILEGYDEAKLAYIREGFTVGFPLGCVGIPDTKLSKNHRSAEQHPEIINDFISKGKIEGRIAGPFLSPPFEPFITSRLGVVPKSEEGKFRVIHDLSFPKNNSVNSRIPPENSQVTYDSIDTITMLVQQFGEGALMSKTDIQDAFRIIPIHFNDHKLLGFSWEGSYYYDKCLPMGASSSCQIFESLSTSLQWVMCKKFQASGMSHMLDDFFFIGPKDSPSCQIALEKFLDICAEAGIPIKHEKTYQPSTLITIYGIEVDSVALQCRLPEPKLVKIKAQLEFAKNRKKFTLRDLQSLIGLLNYACLVVVPGRAFLRRLIDLTCGISCPSHYIRLNREVRADLHMWSHFINNYNGKSVILGDTWLSSDKALLFTDASGSLGFAAVLGTELFALSWDIVPGLADKQIAIKELFPIVVALELWGTQLQNQKILFMSDNAAIVHAINKQTCKEKTLMHLIRRLVLTSLSYNILFKAKHIPGKSNVLADHLSRFNFQAAFQIAPHLNQHQALVPREFLTI